MPSRGGCARSTRFTRRAEPSPSSCRIRIRSAARWPFGTWRASPHWTPGSSKSTVIPRNNSTTGAAESEARQRELTELRAAVQREQAEADRDAATRRGLLAKVRDERAYHERMVGELTEASRRLEAFVRELQAKQRQLARAAPPRAADRGARRPGSGRASGAPAVADGRADHGAVRRPGAPAVRDPDVPQRR